jgi:predicted transcriptional regulator
MNKSEQCPSTMSPTNRTRSRTAVVQRRSVIVALLHQHQNGLTPREIREATGLSKSLTDSALTGLFTRGIVNKRGHRYVLAVKDDSRESLTK